MFPQSYSLLFSSLSALSSLCSLCSYTDTQAPFLSTILEYSNSSNSRNYAKIGDFLFLNFTASEPLLSSPTITFNNTNFSSSSSSSYSSLVSVDTNHDKWQFSVEVTGGETSAGFVIYYEDLAGNVGSPVNYVSLGSEVVIGK